MKILGSVFGGLSIALAISNVAFAGDSETCKMVRFSDVGWTNITATSATTAAVLELMGYEPDILQLSIPVTYASLKNNDIDVFQGYWKPSMDADIKPYLEDGSVEVLPNPNLEGAKYTIAVPTYTYEKGLKDFMDIAKFKDAVNGKIYGIEPGNDGNRHVFAMIGDPKFNLSDWELVESSEAGMMAEVAKSIQNQKDVIFLGWEPHTMNTVYDIKYLTGGDDLFGPNYGGATVWTNTRKGYVAECPNVGQMMLNVSFTVEMENEIMLEMDKGVAPKDAGIGWLKANPAILDKWLAGVTTFDGSGPALDAVKAGLGL